MPRTPLSAPARTKLARLLKKCRSSGLHFDEALVAEAGGDDAAEAVAWDALAGDVVNVGDIDVRRFLLTRAMCPEGAAVLAAHLARQHPLEDSTQLLPRWPRDVDVLVHRAVAVDAAAFAAAEASYDDAVQLGLSFVRWRRGETIPADHAAQIAAELARNTARGNVLAPGGVTLPSLDEMGAEVILTLRTTADVRQLAARISPDGNSRFDEALAEASRENAWTTIADVEAALRVMPRAELVAQLAVRSEWTPRPGVHAVIGATTYRMAQALELFEARLATGADTPDELFAEARRLATEGRRREASGDDDERGDPGLLAMVLAVSAARRAAGEVPADLEEIVSFGRVAEHPSLLDALIAALRSLPSARVHGWMQSVIDSDGAAVAALAAHHDDELLRRVLSGSTPLVVEALASLRSPALPALLEAIGTLPGERATKLRHVLVFVLAAAAAEGQSPPEDLDIELLVAAFDGRPMERERYGAALQAAAERVVNAMPVERRREILTAGYAAAPMSVVAMLHSITDEAELTAHLGTAVVDGMVTSWILRGLGPRAVPAVLAYGGRSNRAAWVRQEAEAALSSADFAQVAHVFVDGGTWRLIETDVAAANAVDPEAARIRVYLLAEATSATPAREGSRSRLGGRPAKLPAALVPTDDDGEPLTHILTIDLDDAPELRATYPDASAILLFTPAPGEGNRAEESEIVALPRANSAAAGTGRPLAVFGIDVPSRVFTDPATLAPPLRAVRDRILHAAGHVLGRPFWLQSKPFDADGDGFVMQINDGLNDELNLGDGALYVYESVIIAQAL